MFVYDSNMSHHTAVCIYEVCIYVYIYIILCVYILYIIYIISYIKFIYIISYIYIYMSHSTAVWYGTKKWK